MIDRDSYSVSLMFVRYHYTQFVVYPLDKTYIVFRMMTTRGGDEVHLTLRPVHREVIPLHGSGGWLTVEGERLT
jgi:hypothetical protein